MALPEWLDPDAFKAALLNAGGAGARTAAELPDDVLEQHMLEAWGEVSGVLRAVRFTPPADDADLDTVPALLVGIVQGIAGYTATLEYFGSQPLEDRDPVNLRYARAQSLLTRLSKGTLTLDGVTEEDPGTAAGSPAAYGGVDVGLAQGYVDDLAGASGFGLWHGMRTGW